MLKRSVLLLTLAACGHAPAAPDTPQPTEAVERPHRLVDGESGAPLTDDDLRARIKDVRVVYVGEHHDDPAHHGAEIAVLRLAHGVDPDLGFAFEMLPRERQGALDDFVRGQTDEATFSKAVDWENTWGFPFGFYRPLLAFCRQHRLQAFAANAPRTVTRTVSKKGLDGLDATERAQLPELEPGPPAHREFAREAFGQHARSRFTDAKFERFYAVQLIWDETMADTVARALQAAGAPRRLVFVAGEGHTRRFAVPARAARRGAAPFLTVLPVTEAEVADARTAQVADVLWVVP